MFAVLFTITQLSELTRVPVAFCLVKFIFGIPCPGCGITTSIRTLLQGDLPEALHANPAGPVVLLFMLAQLLLTSGTVTRLLPDTASVRYSRLNDLALIASLLFAWLARLI